MSTASGRMVALLRGINVGKAKRIAMADLRGLVEELGYTEVQTLLNSGNVVFSADGVSADEAGARIEGAIASELGVQSRVIALSAEEVGAIVAADTLSGVATDHSRLLVAVLADPAEVSRLRPLLEEDWGPEALALGDRVAYLWCPDGVLKSRLPEAVGRIIGDGVTSRNWATVLKLHALVSPV